MEIAFWGAGIFAHNIWEKISENADFYRDHYIGFFDNNPKLWGKYLFDKRILAPLDLKNYKIDRIVITSIYDQEIKKQLMNEMGISEENIYSFEEYDQSCFARRRFDDRYALFDTRNNYNCFDNKKSVVYTAITGEYDDLKDPVVINDDLTYVCFTNNRKLKSDIWHIEYIDDVHLSDIYLARKIKFEPHLFLKEYEVSIWVDGKFSIRNDLTTYVMKYGKESPILCFPHHIRECIYDEAVACLWFRKGVKENIIRQLCDYYKAGYPFRNGLYETGCMVRLHNDEFVKSLMEQWYGQIEAYSYRDQISFPVVCWKNNFLPDICDLNINHNEWLRWHRHSCLQKLLIF